MSSAVKWMPLNLLDLSRVDEIANTVHTGLPERLEVFEEKISIFPDGCFKLLNIEEKIVGYGIAHPWMLYSIPPLDEFLKKIPSSAECIYIHDVVVLPEARGQNAVVNYVDIIRDVSNKANIKKLALVSVYGTDRLWSRFGFRSYSNSEILQKIQSYGETARYMIADDVVQAV